MRRYICTAALLWCGSAVAQDQGIAGAQRVPSEIEKAILNTKKVKDRLAGKRYRVHAANEAVTKDGGRGKREHHAVIYDYTTNKTLHVITDPDRPGDNVVSLQTLTTQLPPSDEEYAEAEAIASRDPRVQQALSKPNARFQRAFIVDEAIGGCDVSRCVDVQVNRVVPGVSATFLLSVIVDLSAQKIVEVRTPKGPNSILGPR
jgi:hypothetical protein